MIKKTFITAAICCVIYTIIILMIDYKLPISQYTKQANIIQGERYLFAKDTVDGIIVGSSLSSGIITEKAKGLYNLSIGGSGPLEGLSLVMKKKTKPQIVLIESNFFFRPVKADYQGNFDEFNYLLKLYLPILRNQNQPVSVFLGLVKKRDAQLLKPSKSGDTKILRNILQIAQKDYKKEIDTKEFNGSLNKMEQIISDLKRSGAKVYFYEMPIDISLQNLPLAVTVRNTIKQHFPDIKYITFPKQHTLQYHTRDGLHLDPYSMYNFSVSFTNLYHQLCGNKLK